MSAEIVSGLVTVEVHNGVVKFIVAADTFMKYAAWTMVGLIFGNVLLGCLFSVPCSQVLPTVSYLGCFGGHERLHVFACTFYALVLFILYLGAFVRLADVVSECTRYMTLGLGVLIAGVLPGLTIVDEINGLHFTPIYWVHTYMILALLALSYSWVYLVHGALSDIQSSLSLRELEALGYLRKLLKISLVATFLTLLEWQLGPSIYVNAVMNESVQALCEWAAICIAIFVPVAFCQGFSDFTIEVSVPLLKAIQSSSEVSVEQYNLENEGL